MYKCYTNIETKGILGNKLISFQHSGNIQCFNNSFFGGPTFHVQKCLSNIPACGICGIALVNSFAETAGLRYLPGGVTSLTAKGVQLKFKMMHWDEN